jgi:sugar phosphate isomerase/epimerase
VDCLEVFGRYVWGVHIKDGEYPTDGHQLGASKPIGQGKVNFPLFIARLAELGFTGVLAIEQAIRPETVNEIKRATGYLESIIARLDA